MRKLLFLAIATAMLGMTFTSCDKEKEEDESSNEFNLKVNQFSYDGKVFDVETAGMWDGRMGWLDVKCAAADFVTTIDHHWDLWESGKTVDLAKDGYPESFSIMGIENELPSSLPEIRFYGKAGEIDGTSYENIFKSGTVTYTGSATAEKLTFKLDAVLANGKSLKFWLEFQQSFK